MGIEQPPAPDIRPQRCYRIVGTAGHIDHGKSALVRELTGTDPDRLQEEKERGITIDLGFAHMDLADDLRVGFIDVPGHERFVKNMLAGIGGIDAVLLVVAADESIMPQTLEHFAICRLLGIHAGLVAITKCDLVESEIVDLVELEVRDYLTDSFLAEAPLVRTSVETGEGIAQLESVLARELEKLPARSSDGLLRLPIDRVFTVHGFGTVVTGTLFSGMLRVGDSLELLPAGTNVTVRGMQVHGEAVDVAHAGQRTALNLQGIEVGELARGNVLVSPGSLVPSQLIDAHLHLLDGFGPLRRLQRLRFHHGAAEVLARVEVFDVEEVEPGGSALVQLRLESAYPVAPGDRFIVRRYSPMVTIGGGIVIDGQPRKHRRSEVEVVDRLRQLEGADDRQRLTTWVAAAAMAGVTEEKLRHRLALSPERTRQVAAEAVRGGGLVEVNSAPLHLVATGPFDELKEAILAKLAGYHAANRLRPGMPKQELRAGVGADVPETVVDAAIETLRVEEKLRAEGDSLALREHQVELTAAQARIREQLLHLFSEARWAPPSLKAAWESLDTAEEAQQVLFHLLREGELVRLRDDLIFHRRALEMLIEELQKRHAPGDRFSVGQFKEWTDVSRKHAIPLLEYLDRRRVTRRVGNDRERI